MTREVLFSGIYQDSNWIVNEQSNCAVLNTRSHCTEKSLECWYNHVQCCVLEQTKQIFAEEKSVMTTDSWDYINFLLWFKKEAFKRLLRAINQTSNLTCIWIRMSFFCRWIRTEIGKEIYPKSRKITMNFSEIIFSSVIFEYFWILARVWYTLWISYRFSNSFY